jgi:4-hydroxyphenylpyruvate dioxygenase
MYVREVSEAARKYQALFGFRPIAEAGPETGCANGRSLVLAQGDARLVLTEPTEDGPIAEFVRRHGEGVRDIALYADNVAAAVAQAVAAGARLVDEPTESSTGPLTCATVAAFDDVVHTIVRTGVKTEALWSGHRPLSASLPSHEHLVAFDHVAICLESGALAEQVDFYKRVFQFVESHEENVETELSGMTSKVVQSGNGAIKFPLQEPMARKPGGQIMNFLRGHGGAGVQHVAFLTGDMIAALRWARERGLQFLDVPNAYYDMLSARVGPIAEDVDVLRELKVLADSDDWGYLLQIFTRSVHARLTLFFEIIQRNQARGFGSANIRALFKAVEHEQVQARRA